ncbi:MAG: hypothetical protein EAZ42_06770 [Verrucomicrobia bacterium]|nr:MAG: hypothetical protein EAZ42_06770 [Verrucomicrobiota bacterium]
MMIPTPHELMKQFERGQIAREEMQAMMALHARELIAEMEEDYQNPVAALIESVKVRRATAKLVRLHGAIMLREILIAFSEHESFPPFRKLWNASHPDVPLYCFFRINRSPSFRILSLTKKGEQWMVEVRYETSRGAGEKRQTFLLGRDENWRMRVLS